MMPTTTPDEKRPAFPRRLAQALFGPPYLPLSLVWMTLIIIFSQAVLELLYQPVAYWADPRQIINNHVFIPWLLAAGPTRFIACALIYMLVMGLLLWRLKRPAALILAGALIFFHMQWFAWRVRVGFPPFFRLTSSTAQDIFQVCIWLVLIALLFTVIIRSLMPVRRVAARWRGIYNALKIILALGWVIFLCVAVARMAFPPASAWKPLAPAHLPPARFASALVTDEERGRVILFGGEGRDDNDHQIYYNDTWEWDGQDWTQIQTASAPTARAGHVMGYDKARKTIILYGGANNNGKLADIWEFDGKNWHKRCPSCNPEARINGRMIFDETEQKLILLGGYSGPRENTKWFSEGWYWTGSCWQNAVFDNSIPVGQGFGIVYERARQRTLAFFSGDGPGYGTWYWKGNSWTLAHLGVEPPHLTSPVLVYDPEREQTVLFGGWLDTKDMFSGYQSPTWIFANNTWRELNLPVSPDPRGSSLAFYDSTRHSILLFGGTSGGSWVYGDMWEFKMPE